MEKRKYERFEPDMAVWIKTREHGFSPTVIDDISAGGVRCIMESEIASEELVEISFELPQYTDLIEVKAKVRHCEKDSSQKFHWGLAFLEVQPISMERLMSYLEELFK